MIASPDLIDRIIASYAFKPEDKQQLANALAKGYLLAKAQAYQRAQAKVAHVVHIRKPWHVSESDVARAQTWAMKQVEGIAQTYETLLRHEIESLPEERALGDLIGKAKQVAGAVSDWITGFLPWKTKQVADNTWSTGDNNGTEQFVNDVQDEGNVDELASDGILRLQIMVEPGTSSSDTCATYAGNTYSLSDDVPNFPIHTNCIHYKTIVVNDQPITRSVEPANGMTCVFIDIDGVLSIPGYGLPQEIIDNRVAYPIPLANALLQAIDQDSRLQPVWMTHWGESALAWNDRAGTRRWPVGFPLHDEADDKPLAIQYYLSQYGQSGNRATWVQDGFSPATYVWAEQANVRIIDTNKEPLHSLLLSDQTGMVSDVMRSLEKIAV